MQHLSEPFTAEYGYHENSVTESDLSINGYPIRQLCLLPDVTHTHAMFEINNLALLCRREAMLLDGLPEVPGGSGSFVRL